VVPVAPVGEARGAVAPARLALLLRGRVSRPLATAPLRALRLPGPFRPPVRPARVRARSPRRALVRARARPRLSPARLQCVRLPRRPPARHRRLRRSSRPRVPRPRPSRTCDRRPPRSVPPGPVRFRLGRPSRLPLSSSRQRPAPVTRPWCRRAGRRRSRGRGRLESATTRSGSAPALPRPARRPSGPVRRPRARVTVRARARARLRHPARVAPVAPRTGRRAVHVLVPLVRAVPGRTPA